MAKLINLNIIMGNAMKEMKENEKFVVVDIPLEYLKIAPNQRERISKSSINQKANNWDSNKCFILKGTWDLGDNKVLLQDGQHRFLAAQKYNEKQEDESKKIRTLKIGVFIGLSHDEKINLFLYQNEGVNKLRYCDKFKSILAKQHRNKDEQAIYDLMQICQKRKILLVGYNDKGIKSTRKIGSIKKSYEIIRDYGIECFEWIIDVLDNSETSYKQGAWNGEFLKALAACYKEDKFNNYYNLIELLKSITTLKELCKDDRGNKSTYWDEIQKRMKEVK